MIKNQAYTATFYLYVPTDGSPAVGATSISVYISKDGGTAIATTNSPAEVDPVRQPGIYKIALTATEMNADNIVLTFSHATYAGMPLTIETSPAAPTVADIQNGLSTFDPSTDAVNVSSSSVESIKLGLATGTNVSSAKADIISAIPSVQSIQSGLSTFNPANDKVTLNDTEDTKLTAIKTKVDSLQNTDLTGIATAYDISQAQLAIIDAMPDISNLSTFNSSTDDVTVSQSAIESIITGVINSPDFRKIFSALFEWQLTSNNTLILRNSEGTNIGTFYVTKNEDGDIVKISASNE